MSVDIEDFNHRWLQADVKLGTTVDGVKPSVSDVKMFWSY